MTTTKTGEASDKRGMTLDELASWVQEAMRLGIPGDARPTAVVKIGGKIKRIEVRG